MRTVMLTDCTGPLQRAAIPSASAPHCFLTVSFIFVRVLFCRYKAVCEELAELREEKEQENHGLKLQVAKFQKNSQLNAALETENQTMRDELDRARALNETLKREHRAELQAVVEERDRAKASLRQKELAGTQADAKIGRWCQ